MEELVEQLKQAYQDAELDCGDRLHPPTSEDEIKRVSDELGLPIPDDLRSVWLIHGGQDYFGAGVSGLFGKHRLLTPTETLEGYELIWDCELDEPAPGATPQLWNRPVRELIPFASWDAYSLCIHSETSEVWEFIPSPGSSRHRPSIEAVSSEVLSVVRAGGEPGLE